MSPVILRIAVIEDSPSPYRRTEPSRRWRVAVNDLMTFPRFETWEAAQEYAEDIRHGRMPTLAPDEADGFSHRFARAEAGGRPVESHALPEHG